MFAATGNHVEELHRERLGGLSLPDDMLPGQWKLLSEKDITLIFQYVTGGIVSAREGARPVIGACCAGGYSHVRTPLV